MRTQLTELLLKYFPNVKNQWETNVERLYKQIADMQLSKQDFFIRKEINVQMKKLQKM